jgi:hypothetical protein
MSSWAYRETVRITNGSTTDTLNDHQVEVVLNTQAYIAAGKMNSDGSDIRFTNNTGCTLLPYAISSGINTTTTTIWVRVPKLNANSTTTLYLYYGNPSASAAGNSDSVFLAFDDFSGTTLDTNRWTSVTSPTGSITVGSGKIVFSGVGSIRSKQRFYTPVVFEMKVDSVAGTQASIAQRKVSDGNGYAFGKSSATNMAVGKANNVSSGTYSLVADVNAAISGVNLNSHWSIHWVGTGKVFATWPGGQTDLDATNGSQNALDSHNVALGNAQGGNGSSYLAVNYVRVRRATDVPLTITIGGSIDLASPNGGESWAAGSTHAITWTSDGVDSVKIELSSNGGSTFPTTIVASRPASDSTYSWTLPVGLTPGSTYRIRVRDVLDSSLNDVSSASFTVRSPATMTVTLDKSYVFAFRQGLQTVNATVAITGGDNPNALLQSITSNEADAGLSSSDIANDIQNASTGTYDTSFALRCEGITVDRIYTIVYRLRDGSNTIENDTVRIPVLSKLGGVSASGQQGIPGVPLAAPDPTILTSTSQLTYTLTQAARVVLKVFTPRGKWFKNIDYGNKSAGTHVITWDGRGADGQYRPNGPYLIQLVTPGGSIATAIILQR